MRIHFIAIGGSAMHNLAIALKEKGYDISGSDDEIFEPSKGRLAKHGLLPAEIGWFPEKISNELDAVVLGMHARIDNPELIRAKEFGLKIYSYPEYLFEQTKEKTRVVIGGSHGKTTITSMVMHVLRESGVAFDYMVGAQLDGFENMVSLSKNAEIAVFEGDEYLTSPIDPRPKFHLYRPHIAVISGIAWDHINAFPTFEGYLEQFQIFIQTIESNGSLVFYKDDKNVSDAVSASNQEINYIPYTAHPHKAADGKYQLQNDSEHVDLHVFGAHNMQNISAAKHVCNLIGVSTESFYQAISSFKGAAKRLQLLAEGKNCKVFLDFAHSPSKVAATVKAVRDAFPHLSVVACLELHTFSSLNPSFLPQYKDSLEGADIPIVYFNPSTLEHKKLPLIAPELVKESFGNPSPKVFTDSQMLVDFFYEKEWDGCILLIMTSGNFSGQNLQQLACKLVE